MASSLVQKKNWQFNSPAVFWVDFDGSFFWFFWWKVPRQTLQLKELWRFCLEQVFRSEIEAENAKQINSFKILLKTLESHQKPVNYCSLSLSPTSQLPLPSFERS